ncbi:hypothetical protein Hanom_Chr06g00530871 [Helianthus anomalus]
MQQMAIGDDIDYFEQAKVADFKGYTGKPIYSVWYGSESENRAVFVDEVKCVGCLKCALMAEKTFAIQSVYSRARVIAQWGDPENKIHEAIEVCPVNCISCGFAQLVWKRGGSVVQGAARICFSDPGYLGSSQYMSGP